MIIVALYCMEAKCSKCKHVQKVNPSRMLGSVIICEKCAHFFIWTRNKAANASKKDRPKKEPPKTKRG